MHFFCDTLKKFDKNERFEAVLTKIINLKRRKKKSNQDNSFKYFSRRFIPSSIFVKELA